MFVTADDIPIGTRGREEEHHINHDIFAITVSQEVHIFREGDLRICTITTIAIRAPSRNLEIFEAITIMTEKRIVCISCNRRDH